MTNQATRKPWQKRAVSPMRPDVVVSKGRPLAQITIYPEMVLYTRQSGNSWRQYPISVAGLAQVLSRAPTLSGLLPRHCLGTGRINGTPFYVVYVPAHRATLRTEQQAFTIPLPPLIWGGCGADFRIWALDISEYPSSMTVPLMVAPFPNCYKNGGVCWGTSDPRPAASGTTLDAVLDLFLQESYFNLHLTDHKSVEFSNSVIARWQQLVDSAAEAYPLDDLMPAEIQLIDVLEGRAWAGSR